MIQHCCGNHKFSCKSAGNCKQRISQTIFFFYLTCSRSTQLNKDSFLAEIGSWWLEWIFLFTLLSTTSMMPLTVRLFPQSNESVNAIKYLEVFSYLKLNCKFRIRQLSNKLSRTLFSIKSAPKSISIFLPYSIWVWRRKSNPQHSSTVYTWRFSILSYSRQNSVQKHTPPHVLKP
jgi:hypothetical protein